MGVSVSVAGGFGLSDAGWRKDVLASCSGSGMLRIPRHSASMLWLRTVAALSSPWSAASS